MSLSARLTWGLLDGGLLLSFFVLRELRYGAEKARPSAFPRKPRPSTVSEFGAHEPIQGHAGLSRFYGELSVNLGRDSDLELAAVLAG